MIDGKKLLDQFLGAEAGRSGVPTGVGSSGGAPQTSSGMTGGLGGLGDLLGGLTGGGGASGGLGGVLGQVTDYAKKNPGMSTVIAGGLASVLMGSGGSKLKPNALTLGGLAALGTLAYKAYQQYQINNPAAPAAPAPAPAGASLPPVVTQSTATAEDAAALSIIIAMIAAAKADGHVDDEERQKILGKLSENGLTAEEQTFLDRELAAPLDFNRVVGLATSQEQAIQLYAASLLAINADQPAERGYLDMLAARLGIEPGLKTAIEQTVASAAA
ncbi:MAG TPA: tellurite resistance TerB family protein [Kaistia sp.]|nr:tellurite resistance TerB family protein [Kaistia sp.]